jgi:membrane protein YqaA with SNARE-associated domain
MVLITDLAFVFVMSIFELWVGIPIGLFLNLNPILVATSAAAGSILSAIIIVILGEGLRTKFLKWRYRGESLKKGRIYDIWKNYGTVGLGLLSPLLFGAPLGAALGIGLGSPRNKLLLWMIIGIIIWSIFITAAFSQGLNLL